MDSPASPAQPLAEFIAAVSAVKTEAAAAQAVVEHAAEALDADVAAIVCDGKAVAMLGYGEGSAPVAELERVRPGAAEANLVVPGIGECAAVAATLDHPPGATLVIARQGRESFSRQEIGTLRGIAQVAATTMRVLHVLDDERAAREELGQLADEQAALRRVATLVARGVRPRAVFAAVAEEVAHVLPMVDFAMVGRYDSDGTVEAVGAWSNTTHELLGMRTPLGGQNASSLVFTGKQAARVDHLDNDESTLTDAAREIGIRSSAGAPISIEGRLWGVMVVASAREDALPTGVEHRLADFTELVATAIANAQARQELSSLAAEQTALHRVATLVAHGEPPPTVFAAVAKEIGRLLAADLTLVRRYDADGAVTVVGAWTKAGEPVPMRSVPLGGRNVTTLVRETGQPARMDSYAAAWGPAAEDARARGIRSAVGAPIGVDGRLWGVIVVGLTREEPLPSDIEQRLTGFTELLATAIANAQARLELRGHAEEQAALRRMATLVAAAAPPGKVFAAVTEEVGRILDADLTVLIRYEPNERATAVGRWSVIGDGRDDGHSTLGGRNVTTLVYRTGQPARLDDYADASGALADFARSDGLRTAVGVPIRVDGRLWGVMMVGSARKEPLPPDTESRLAGFTELVATAIANTEAQAALAASRARIVTTADSARRRIERDLHDGAQQRIVSLALQLRTAHAAVPPDAFELARELDDVATGLGEVLDELREIAGGIHPAALAEGGLPRALRTLARRSAVPVNLDVNIDDRLPEPVELAAYYIAAETLTNAAKHAEAASVDVQVHSCDGMLHIRIRDEGRGGADVTGGSGLLGLKDRVEAFGGTIFLHSPAGAGTTVEVDLPLGDRRMPRPQG